jgi:hypothetical protein
MLMGELTSVERDILRSALGARDAEFEGPLLALATVMKHAAAGESGNA